jgi:protein-tyrosine-phosphatase
VGPLILCKKIRSNFIPPGYAAKRFENCSIFTKSAGRRFEISFIGIINPKAIAAMKELGYDLTRHDSKSLDDIPDVDYEYAVTMGCGDACPLVRAKHREDWQIPDPRNMNGQEFRAVRDLIAEKVKALLYKIY